MPRCKNDITRTYIGTEPSPNGLGIAASGEEVGKKMKGQDNNMWIVKQTKSGTKKWHLVKKRKPKNDFVWYEKKEKGETDILKGLYNKKGYIFKFISYNKFDTKPTQVPDDYTLVRLNKRFVNQHYCGNKNILKKKQNTKHKNHSYYFVNNDKYIVYFDKNMKTAHVYTKPKNTYIENIDWYSDKDKKDYYHTLIRNYSIKKAFIDQSILLHISNKKYAYIGKSIYEFTIDDIIDTYTHMKGVGEKNIYLLNKQQYINTKSTKTFRIKKTRKIHK
jgi:hypothetical protein